MLQEIASHVRRGENFAFETTLSDRRYVSEIPRWQHMGYRVKMVFLYLLDVAIAIERVRVRVKQGGHHIPEHVICRRYQTGWKNFQEVYKNLVDSWVLYDNSGKKPVLLDAGEKQ